MSKNIRVFDYVNHPYEAVRNLLTTNASAVFSNATKVAALRAEDVASEFHVNIGGIEIGTDISISVKTIKYSSKKIMFPAKTNLQIEWEAAKMPRLFPFMKAELSIYPLTSTETQLTLEGNYAPPLDLLGKAIDAVVGHRIAEASVHQFIKDISAYVGAELSKQ